MKELARYLKFNHPGFAEVGINTIFLMLKQYAATTIVIEDADGIKGVGLYQDWPDRYHFILICGTGTPAENFKAIVKSVKHIVNGKKISWYDENKMELREIKCRCSSL